MNAVLEALVANPSHAILVTGPDEMAATESTELANTLLANHKERIAVVSPDAEKGKQSITIEQIRKLHAFFRLKVPGTAAVKRVAVVTAAEHMTLEAQNALLKTLEEPPADSVLILASSQPQNLLPTIRSRVQSINLPATNITPDTEVVQQVKQVLGGTTYDRLLLVDRLAKQKGTATEFVSTLTTVAMASLEAAARKGSTSLDRWQTILQAARTAEDALTRSANAKLVLTELMLAL